MPERRTQRSVTFLNPDGSFTGPVAADRLQLVPAERPGYAYRNSANGFDAFFKEKGVPGYLRFEVGGAPVDLSLVSLVGAAQSAARVSGEEIVYPKLLEE